MQIVIPRAERERDTHELIISTLNRTVMDVETGRLDHGDKAIIFYIPLIRRRRTRRRIQCSPFLSLVGRGEFRTK